MRGVTRPAGISLFREIGPAQDVTYETAGIMLGQAAPVFFFFCLPLRTAPLGPSRTFVLMDFATAPVP